MMTEEKKRLKLPTMEPHKVLPKLRVPLVGVEIPEFSLPEFPPKPPKLDREQMDAVRFGIMDDIADIIPFVGDPAADLAYAELRKKLTPEQYERFLQENKLFPSSIAVLKVLAEKGVK